MSRIPSVMKNFSKDSAFVTYESSSGTLDFTLSANFATYSNFEYELLDVRLHVIGTAATTSENFTVSLDANMGSPYDVVFYSTDMSEYNDKHYYPDVDLCLAKDDDLRFQWVNSGKNTYGLAVRWRKLS
jgi:hypothetical protein